MKAMLGRRAISVAVLVLLSIPLSAGVVVAADYGLCTSGAQDGLNTYQLYASRNFAQTSWKDGVRVTFKAQVVNTCSGTATLSKYGSSYSPIISLQQFDTSGYQLHLGIGRCNAPPGYGCSFDPGNQKTARFVWTDTDQTGGLLKAWGIGPALQWQHDYTFEIRKGTGTWIYTITDLTTGQSGTRTQTSHWSSGQTTWWGGEDQNSYDKLGSSSPGLNLNMSISYRRVDDGLWWFATDGGSSTLTKRHTSGLAFPCRYKGSKLDEIVNVWSDDIGSC